MGELESKYDPELPGSLVLGCDYGHAISDHLPVLLWVELHSKLDHGARVTGADVSARDALLLYQNFVKANQCPLI
jgi:hypothetical protein